MILLLRQTKIFTLSKRFGRSRMPSALRANLLADYEFL
jgi:hypothetical protein